MTVEDIEHWVAYCSPGGSTRHVAGVIAAELQERGRQVNTVDLGSRGVRQEPPRSFPAGSRPVCLWLGSPVYVNHVVPPVAAFLGSLPERGRGWAVPFVTWGGVCSGTALHELGNGLALKGYELIGGAKILARHSSMWMTDEPLGAGHPDAEDDAMIRRLVRRVDGQLAGGTVAGFPPERLDYQPPTIRDASREASLERAKPSYPRLELDRDVCTQCAVCEEECPAGAVRLAPFPEIGEACFLCSSCARLCPEGALEIDLSQVERRIRAKADQIREEPPSQVFV